ncbi:MAG: hypothetical protein KGZ83_10805 [Sulfuricella sp.]|nr:hypothetical protein [Sulfuricella sp.]
MTPKIAELIERIHILQDELELELARKREELRYTLIDRKVRFEQEMLKRHRAIKTGLLHYIFKARLRNVISAPVIYAMFFPMLLLDACVTLYQWVCFPLYRIPRVKRRDYVIYDRHNLAYLNLLEKINCTYCSYGNGLLSYIKEIVARTEQYWCPIKHAQRLLQPHSRYSRFADFGDAEGYRRELEKLRCDFDRPGNGK